MREVDILILTLYIQRAQDTPGSLYLKMVLYRNYILGDIQYTPNLHWNSQLRIYWHILPL